MATRERYRERWSAIRIAALRQRIAVHQPKAVIFYSFGYLPYWQAIVGTPLQPVLAGELYMHQTAGQLYAVIKHTAAAGVTSAYFHEAGKAIRQALTSLDPQKPCLTDSPKSTTIERSLAPQLA